jgi:hypothetical protein
MNTISALYYANRPILYFIVPAHWNKQSAGKQVASLWHIILIPSQPVFAITL